MNDQLAQLLKFLTDTLQQGKDFTVEQAPQFVRELLLWKFYQCEVWIGVGVFVIVMGILLAWWVSGFSGMSVDDKRGVRGFLILGGLFLGFCIITANVYSMVQIKVAPRVVIVEMVRELLAGQRN